MCVFIVVLYSTAGILEQSMGARNRLEIGLSYRPAGAGIFKQSLGARNRVGIGLSYRPASAGIFKQPYEGKEPRGCRTGPPELEFLSNIP